MAKFTLEIDTNNAAFEYDLEAELGSILMTIARKVQSGKGFDFKLRDSNGNTVGSAYLEESESESDEE